MLASSWLLHVNFNITDDLCCFPDSSGAEVSLVLSRSVAAHDVVFAQRPRPACSQHFGPMGARNQPSSFLHISCFDKCATVLYCTAAECRLWLRVAVCTPPQTHPSHCRSVHLCWRGSVKFRCISKYTAPFYLFIFAFQSERA